MTDVPLKPVARLSGHQRSRFFVWAAVAMVVVIVLGFGKSFYLRPAFTDQALPVYLIVHGVVMTAWYLLFLAQAGLVSIGRRDLHRTLGIAGIAVAVGVVVTGAIVHLNFIPRHQATGRIAGPDDLAFSVGFVLEGLGSLVPFAILIALAVLLQRHTAIHKRLMYWAMVWTLGPAFTDNRPLGKILDGLVVPYLPYFPSDLFWLAALMAFDWKTLRRIHPATYLTFLTLALWYLVITKWIVASDALRDWLLTQVQVPL